MPPLAGSPHQTARRLPLLINHSSGRMILNAGFGLEYCNDFRKSYGDNVMNLRLDLLRSACFALLCPSLASIRLRPRAVLCRASHAVGAARHTATSGRASACRVAAVLDLPGVVEDVPGDPAGRVAGRPALRPRRRAVGGRAEHRDDVVAQRGDGGLVVDGRLAVLDAELAGV